MRTLILAMALLWAAGAAAVERHGTPEGWYQVEDGYGETEDSEYFIEVEPAVVEVQAPAPMPRREPPAAPQQPTPRASAQPQPPGQPAPVPQPPPSIDDEIREFQRVDCELARGEYLARVMELHGVDPFWTDPRELAPLTYERPPPGSALLYGFGGALGDPALALLYGEPPVPAGTLSGDFQLQVLARQLLRCPLGTRALRPVPPPSPPPASAGAASGGCQPGTPPAGR